MGETTRPFKNNLNQIPYTVEVRNRFKGLDLIDRLPDELWMEVHDIVKETGMKTIPPQKKEIQKSKMACWGPAPADPGYSKERRPRRLFIC